MPVAIETVIIVIVVVSFAVLGAVVFALYWLWRLLLEDRRCTRLGSDWPRRPTVGPYSIVPPATYGPGEGPERALLPPRTPARFPRITRRSDVIVDERGRRMVSPRAKRGTGNGRAHPTQLPRAPPNSQPEVVVIDDTEPPPPYEATRS